MIVRLDNKEDIPSVRSVIVYILNGAYGGAKKENI